PARNYQSLDRRRRPSSASLGFAAGPLPPDFHDDLRSPQPVLTMAHGPPCRGTPREPRLRHLRPVIHRVRASRGASVLSGTICLLLILSWRIGPTPPPP